MARYKAKLDGFDLKLENISDTTEMIVPQYIIPFKHGGKVGGCGSKPPSYQFRIWFNRNTFEEHIRFREYFSQTRLSVLVHPIYGIISGRVTSISINHGDRPSAVSTDISFVESVDEQFSSTLKPDIVMAIESGFVSGQAAAMQKFFEDMVAVVGEGPAGAIMQIALDPNAGILAQMNSVTGAARTYLQQVDTAVNTLNAALDNIQNPAESIISIVEYAQTLPGVVIGSVTKTIERYSEALVSLSESPSAFISSMRSEISKLIGTAPALATEMQIALAQYLPVAISHLYETDEGKRQQLRNAEKAQAFDAAGNYLRQEELPQVYTINEIENSLYLVREDIQAAIDAIRASANGPGSIDTIDNLTDMAHTLLLHVNSIKLERERIVKVTIETPMHLFLVCQRYDLPYSYAERICAINSFRDPSEVSGEILIYAR